MSKQRDLGRRPVSQQIDPTLQAEGHDAQYAGDVAAELARTCNAQVHEIIDALAASVIGAQAGLNWLRAQPQDQEEVRKALNSIVDNGKRACEIVVGLRALMQKVAAADGATDPRADNHCLYEYTP